MISHKATKIILVISCLLIGFIGMMLYTVGYHLYIDHQNLHTVINLIQQANKPK